MRMSVSAPEGGTPVFTSSTYDFDSLGRLFTVSSSDAGTVTVHPAAFDIQLLLNRLDHAFSGAVQAKGLRLRVRPSTLRVVTDALLLERIVSNLVAADPRGTQWRGGTIYDPTSGRTYDCELRVRDDDRLDIRGYFGLRLIGRTVTWTRVGSEERLCRE